jgi:hypothetical protein
MVPLSGANGVNPVGIRRPQIKMKEEVVVMSQSFQQLMEESERKKKGRQDRNRDTANRSRKKKQDYTQVLELEVNRLTKIKETLARHTWGAGSTSACSKSGTSDDIKNCSVFMKASMDGRDADGAHVSEKNSSTQNTKEGGDSRSTSSTWLSLELKSILLGDRGGNVGESTVAQDANDLQVLIPQLFASILFRILIICPSFGGQSVRKHGPPTGHIFHLLTQNEIALTTTGGTYFLANLKLGKDFAI